MTGEGSSVGRKLRSSESGSMSVISNKTGFKSKLKQKRSTEHDDEVVPLKKKKKNHSNKGRLNL